MDSRFHHQLCTAESMAGPSLAADTLGASLQTSTIGASSSSAEADVPSNSGLPILSAPFRHHSSTDTYVETNSTTRLANQSKGTERGGPYNDYESCARRPSSACRPEGPDRDESLARQVSISRGSNGFLVMSPLVQDSAAGRQGSQASIQEWLDAEPPLPPSLTAHCDESLVQPRSSMDQDGPDRMYPMTPQSQDGGSGSSSTSSTPTLPLKPLTGEQEWQPDTEDLVDAETWHKLASTTFPIPLSSTAFGRSSPSASSSTTLVGEDTRSQSSSYGSEDGSVASISTAREPRDSAGGYLGTMARPDNESAESDDGESGGSNGVVSGSEHTGMQGLPSRGADVAGYEASGSRDKGNKRADVEHGSSSSDEDSDFFRQRKRMRGNDEERYYAARKTLRTVLYGAARAHEQGDEVIESMDAIARIFDLERALHHERMMKCSLLSQLQMTQKQVEERDREIEEHEAFWLENSMEDDTESGSSGEQDEDQHSNFSVAGSVQELDEDGDASEDGGVINVFL